MYLSLHLLLVSSVVRSAQGFRFGGSSGGRDLLHLDVGFNTFPANRRQLKRQKQNKVVSSSPAAATKGNGSDEASSSQTSPRRSRGSAGVDKPKDLPRRFPLRNIPLFDEGVEQRSEKEDEIDPATRSTPTRNVEEDESFHSVVNSMVEDIQQINSPASRKVSGEIELDDHDDSDDNDTGSAVRRPNGKRVTFFASKECSRTISLDEEYSQWLDEYMTLPLEQYSVKSFHDGGPNSKMEGRRWFLRRLDAEESAQYMAYEPRDNHEDYIRNGGLASDQDGTHNHEHGRFFRLAVPLAPLIGVELTPVIDLEVIPALKQPSTMEESGDLEQSEPRDSLKEEASELSSSPRPIRQPLRAVRRALRRGRRNQQRDGNNKDEIGEIDDMGEVGVVRVQSLRVSLLSTEDEVKALMKTRNRASKPIDRPTQVSQNPSVQQIGTEAIGVVGRVEQAIEPHITFDATITWDQHAASGPSVTVKSTAVTSLTIPKRAMAFRVPLPLPLGVLVRRIGSLLTKKALEITLPRFLRQLERDLERWARGGDDDER